VSSVAACPERRAFDACATQHSDEMDGKSHRLSSAARCRPPSSRAWLSVHASVCQRIATVMVVARLGSVTSLIKQRSSLRSVCEVVSAAQTAGTSCASARMR
jgi:hypothetical protein